MKKLFLIFLFVAGVVFSQEGKIPIIPFLWQVDQTTGEITPINSGWYLSKNLSGLNNVVNRPQIKKSSSSTLNRIPKWANTTGDSLIDGYDVGTAANNLVQLDGTGKLPAVDGSQLTSLPSFILDLKRLTANFTTNSTGYTSAGLAASLLANTTYFVQGMVRFYGTTTNEAKIKFEAQGATGTKYTGFYSLIDESATTTNGFKINDTSVLEFTNTASNAIVVYLNLTVTTSSTAGTFRIYVRNTSGNDATVEAGSYFAIQRTQ